VLGFENKILTIKINDFLPEDW